ncbi:MAG TPA: hypothetical protein VJ373_04545 [Desulfatiglandales bacterium]|nr:hypothetical protein [Desulfatiglandales bacterium]
MVAKKKFKKEVIGISRSMREYLFILTVSFLIFIDNNPAYSIDFVTEEDFTAYQNTYKDYPIRLLFKKLAESDESGKKEIRNIIILKQVFDPDAQKKDAGPVPEYKETYGIIKEISEEKLRVWVPETDSYLDYYIGIYRIPTEKSGRYKITQSDIGKYTSFIYTLDERVYKIKIDFLLAPPKNLYVKRKDDKNSVGWSEPGSEEKPYRYRIFRNGEPFDTVEGTAADVPREKGKADSYYVKSIYKRGSVLVESGASDVIQDETTIKELQQEHLADEIYDRVIASLNPEGYEDAKRLLTDNRQLFEESLGQDKKENVKILMSFFQDIEDGDRLGAGIPETEELLDNVLTLYESAEKKAKALPAVINVLSLANQRIDLYQNKKALLTEARLKEEARLAEEARLKEEARLAEEARIKEEARLAEEARLKEEVRLAEEARLKEEVRLAEETRLKEEAAKEEAPAQEEATIASQEPVKEPVSELAPEKEAAVEKYDRDAMILLAMKDFDDKKYTSSWDNFRKIFRDQISKIGQGGKNQVLGVLALPVECRAEIFFLIELDRLKNSDDGTGITEQGLGEIKNRIDNKEGLWVIMGESSKTKKIKRHISQFEAGSFE